MYKLCVHVCFCARGMFAVDLHVNEMPQHFFVVVFIKFYFISFFFLLLRFEQIINVEKCVCSNVGIFFSTHHSFRFKFALYVTSALSSHANCFFCIKDRVLIPCTLHEVSAEHIKDFLMCLQTTRHSLLGRIYAGILYNYLLHFTFLYYMLFILMSFKMCSCLYSLNGLRCLPKA